MLPPGRELRVLLGAAPPLLCGTLTHGTIAGFLPPQGKGHSGPQVPSFRPYLLALLTHQSNWSTLHQCTRLLLSESREHR